MTFEQMVKEHRRMARQHYTDGDNMRGQPKARLAHMQAGKAHEDAARVLEHPPVGTAAMRLSAKAYQMTLKTRKVDVKKNPGDGYTRVGVAFSKPRGKTQRREQYGIWRSSGMPYGIKTAPKLYAQYEGYREQRADGEAQVGLPLGGPGWRPQPMTDFVPSHYAEVRFFDKNFETKKNPPRTRKLTDRQHKALLAAKRHGIVAGGMDATFALFRTLWENGLVEQHGPGADHISAKGEQALVDGFYVPGRVASNPPTAPAKRKCHRCGKVVKPSTVPGLCEGCYRNLSPAEFVVKPTPKKNPRPSKLMEASAANLLLDVDALRGAPMRVRGAHAAVADVRKVAPGRYALCGVASRQKVEGTKKEVSAALDYFIAFGKFPPLKNPPKKDQTLVDPSTGQRHTYAAIRKAVGKRGFDMKLVGEDAKAVSAAVNQGIDSRLEACLVPERGDIYKVEGRKLVCLVSAESMPVLLRRLLEDGDESGIGSSMLEVLFRSED